MTLRVAVNSTSIKSSLVVVDAQYNGKGNLDDPPISREPGYPPGVNLLIRSGNLRKLPG
ncbi:hypothetical protein [Mycobacteroides chelonae]|jgi:hypothetical protein|uniref:hypothetical protein n=1 Tax=Mycobacteroides chelonae TaxID=1774 RepID=UPI000B2A36C7|nr:hypothetical protein [Mycobacteroides chelonae]